jgi:hypothetical protein
LLKKRKEVGWQQGGEDNRNMHGRRRGREEIMRRLEVE